MVLVPALVLFAVLVLLRARAGSPGWTGRQALLRLGGALYAAAVLQLTIFPLHVVLGTYANQTPWYEMVQRVPLIRHRTRARRAGVLTDDVQKGAPGGP